jgi:hypothetical protein
VQFYVYVENPYDEWQLQWGRGADAHQNIPAPKSGSPAKVLLTDSENPLRDTSGFKQFPEELFPSTVAGTDGLDTLLLDHAPRWEPAKRRALLNWLRAGGKLHLLKSADGRFPIFSDELSVLNSPLEELQIGAGIVVPHAVAVREFHPEDLGGPATNANSNELVTFSADTFFGKLTGLSQPKHSWALIYLFSIVYMALVGPGNFLLGRRFGNYRVRLALLLITIAAFTAVFHAIGRAGQRNSAVVHTLSYARALDADTYNVTQWSSAFATHGAEYKITHNAPHNLYATGLDYEPVNGMIQNGKEGTFLVDMPIFSRRTFLHQAEMKGANITAKIIGGDSTASHPWAVRIDPSFGKQILEAHAVQGEHLFRLQVKEDRLEISGERAFSELSPNNGGPQPFSYGPHEENENVEMELRKAVDPMIGWSLGFVSKHSSTPTRFHPDDGRVQLFLFTRSPETFRITSPQFKNEIGYVLYHLDLFPTRERKP